MIQKNLVFDLETTGTHPYLHGIHQLSGMITVKGKIKERFNFNIKPYDDCEYDPNALEVCGITRKQINTYPAESEVYTQFMALLKKYRLNDSKDKYFLMGYFNLHMDNDFLSLFMKRNAIINNPYASFFWSGALDVSVLALEKLKNERDNLENFKLATVAKYLNIKVNDKKLHGACYDAELTWQIYTKLNQ